jgi:predicted MFS family arabinose efflux permease
MVAPACLLAGAFRNPLPVVISCAFFGSATFTSVAPFLNEMARDLGVSVALVGQLTSASSLASAIAALVLFPLIEALPPKRLLVLSLVTVGLCSALTGIVAWFPALLLCQFGVGAASATVATTTLIVLGRVYHDPALRARRQGLLIGSFGSGALLGTPVLRWVAGWAGWQDALLAFGGAALVVAGLVIVALPPLAAGDARAALPMRARLARAVVAARAPVVLPALATSFLIWASWGVLGAFLAGYYVHRYPSREGWIALLWTVDGLAFLLGAFGSGILLARIADPLRAVAGAVVGMLLSVTCFAWLAVNPILSLAFFGVWAALIGVSSNALVVLYDRHAGPRTPALLFLDAALGKLAMVVGGLSGGLALELAPGYTGWSALLVVGGLFALLSTLSLIRHPSPRPTAAPLRPVAEDASVAP